MGAAKSYVLYSNGERIGIIDISAAAIMTGHSEEYIIERAYAGEWIDNKYFAEPCFEPWFQEFAYQWNEATFRIISSGYDLSKIPIIPKS